MYITATPTEDQRLVARAMVERLKAMPDTPLELRTGEATSLEWPVQLRSMLEQLLLETAQGHAVALVSLEEELSTQQAADVLNVSRPFLIGLLEDGQIPFYRVGSHRRVKLADVVAFKEDNREKRRAVLAELVAEAQELGMGY
jgi:excisionase family DNA binding protein